jgi:hypothetical protein
MKVENLRSLIRESINEYIREIDNAGTKAGLTAKIEATEGAIAKREKMANMEGIDEAYHEMLDKGKMKEIGNEVKALKKSLDKLKKQLDKLNSKSEPKAEVIKDEAIDEASIEEDDIYKVQKMGGQSNWNDRQRGLSWNSDQLYDDAQLEEELGDEFGGNKVPKKFEDSDSTDWVEDETGIKGKFSDKKSKGYYEKGEVDEARFKKGTDIGKKGKGFAKIAKAAGKEYGSEEAGKRVAGSILKKVLNKEGEEATINESFLKMQKMAGVITEAQYNQKKSLVEGEVKNKYVVKSEELSDKDGDFYAIDNEKALDYLSQFNNEDVNAEQFIYDDEGWGEFEQYLDDVKSMTDEELEKEMREEMSRYFFSNPDSI